MNRIFTALILTCCLLPAERKTFELPGTIKKYVNDYCIKCHNKEKAKGDTRLDNAVFSIKNEAEAQHWKDILDVLNLDEMPPEKAKEQPTLKEKEAVIGDLTESLEHARKMLVDKGGEVIIRYMNNREYKNVMFDLLGTDINVTSLPLDSGEGFDTLAGSQYFSSIRFETYNKLAEEAIKKMFAEAEIRKKTKAKKVRRNANIGKTEDFAKLISAAEKNLQRILAVKGNPQKIKELGLGAKYDRAVGVAKNNVRTLKAARDSKYLQYYKQ